MDQPREGSLNHGSAQYANGDEKIITIEGIHLRDPVHKAGNVIWKVQKFPAYLLEPSITMIRTIMERTFEPVALPARVTLFWVRDLQRTSTVTKVALKEKLNHVCAGVMSVPFPRQYTAPKI